MSKRPTVVPTDILPPPPPEVIDAALAQSQASGTAFIKTELVDGELVQSAIDPLETIDPIADAPRDGTIIDLSPDGKQWVAARWHKTRGTDVVEGRMQWVDKSGWILAVAFIARTPIKFEPIAWRRHMGV